MSYQDIVEKNIEIQSNTPRIVWPLLYKVCYIDSYDTRIVKRVGYDKQTAKREMSIYLADGYCAWIERDDK